MSDHPLRAWRKAQKRTLIDLSAEAGIDAPHLSRIERWEIVPTLEIAVRLADIAALDPRAFLRPRSAD